MNGLTVPSHYECQISEYDDGGKMSALEISMIVCGCVAGVALLSFGGYKLHRFLNQPRSAPLTDLSRYQLLDSEGSELAFETFYRTLSRHCSDVGVTRIGNDICLLSNRTLYDSVMKGGYS